MGALSAGSALDPCPPNGQPIQPVGIHLLDSQGNRGLITLGGMGVT